MGFSEPVRKSRKIRETAVNKRDESGVTLWLADLRKGRVSLPGNDGRVDTRERSSEKFTRFQSALPSPCSFHVPKKLPLPGADRGVARGIQQLNQVAYKMTTREQISEVRVASVADKADTKFSCPAIIGTVQLTQSSCTSRTNQSQMVPTPQSCCTTPSTLHTPRSSTPDHTRKSHTPRTTPQEHSPEPSPPVSTT